MHRLLKIKNVSVNDKQTILFLSPDFDLRVDMSLHSVWLRAATWTVEDVEATNRREESEEKHTWLAELRIFGSLDTCKKQLQ